MMKSFRAVLRAVAGTLLVASGRAIDTTWTYAVQVTATVSADPARVDLAWTTDDLPVRDITVQRKAPGDRTWGDSVVLGGDATGFSDDKVEAGKAYEYQIIRHTAGYAATGYIAVGVNAPLVDARGRVVLVVDRSIADAVSAELKQLESDLVGDGWTVARKDVARDASPADVKEQIKAEWIADRERTKAVLLFGHIPVVRSGNQNVDGHGARPMPADVFYGEMDGEWTDVNRDGIYDPSTLPSDVELMVGRVDFADMPGQYSANGFPGEVDLLKRYLEKDHAFRHGLRRPKPRALVGNGIGDAAGQAYAASAYRSFAALLGPANVTTVPSQYGTPEDERWMARLVADDYLWAYACGAGSDFSVGAMGGHGEYGDAWSSDFLEKKPKGTFYMMFGSWFGDWAKPDNLMRAAIAAPDYGLAACYSGRPHFFYHHMGIGEPIGYGVRLSQNNNGLYQNQVQRGLRGVHIALMGDPTLRLQQLAPPTEAVATTDGSGVAIAWKESRDKVLGYHVYRAASAGGPFVRLSEAPVADTRFVDPNPGAGAATYLVRAIVLNVGPSGSFYNASQGAFASIGANPAAALLVETNSVALTKPSDIVWFDDALPTGAIPYSVNDRWNWVGANPAPLSGTLAHQSDLAPGLHHHFFAFASPPLSVNAGDTLFAYVFLDPDNPPSQIMLTWLGPTWEHRVYWGDNLITEGTDGTASRHSMGSLPPTGRWVRLEVPASALDLENQAVIGMGFTLVNGRATWDRAGKSRPAP